MVRLLGSTGQVFPQRGLNTTIGAPLGFDLGGGLCSLTTSLTPGLSKLGGTTDIGATVNGAAGHGLSAWTATQSVVCINGLKWPAIPIGFKWIAAGVGGLINLLFPSSARMRRTTLFDGSLCAGRASER
jgi:hypothetical protein